MAIYTNLPIYKDSYLLLLLVAKVLKDTSRDCRFTIGEDLRGKIMNLILLIYQANREKVKIGKILEMRETTLQIQVYIRLMWDLREVSEKKYLQLVEKTTEISKQLSAWEKFERSKRN